MLDDYSLEQLRSHPRVPHTFRINDDNGTSSTNAKTGSLAALHASRAEQKTLALKQRCKK